MQYIFRRKYSIFTGLLGLKVTGYDIKSGIAHILCLFLSNKNRNFQGKIINQCQIPPGYLQINFAALHIVKTQLFLTA